jgi:ribosome biogenesis GTPase
MTSEERLARLAAIGLNAAILERIPPGLQDGLQLLRVSEVHRDAVTLHDGVAEHRARVLPALRHELAAAGDEIATGDWVLTVPGTAGGDPLVHERLAPLTQLARRLHDGREKVTRAVIASNVDTALLVMGLDHDFDLRRLERYLALVHAVGIEAVVVLTKADLCDEVEARIASTRAMLPPGVEVIALATLRDDAAARLRRWLGAGRTLVLLGSSGAGKSTLTNALTGTLGGGPGVGPSAQPTGGTRKGDDRGRHTTTARSLHPLAGGACVVDTPGLRTLRLDGDPDALADVFPEVAEAALRCRFRDCRHENEPGCAVRGIVSPERLRNYQKLLRESRRDSMSALERKAQVDAWKVRARAARVRDAERRRGSD